MQKKKTYESQVLADYCGPPEEPLQCTEPKATDERPWIFVRVLTASLFRITLKDALEIQALKSNTCARDRVKSADTEGNPRDYSNI